MPKVNYVQKAQQRYKMVPVLDENGQPTYRTVQRKRPTKRGATEIRQRVTVADKSQPLPNLRCDFPGRPTGEIAPGEAFMWIKPKSGPYGGAVRNRHSSHPTWHPWEYSSSLSARTAQISHDAWKAFSEQTFESPEDVTALLEQVAEDIRALAEEKRESASNIEDGFGHTTSQSEELESIADELETWADDVEQTEVPELPEPEDVDCDECGGTGTLDETCDLCEGTGSSHDADGLADGDCPACEGEGFREEEQGCTECDGSGQVQAEEPTDDQMDEWRSEVEEIFGIVDECPV